MDDCRILQPEKIEEILKESYCVEDLLRDLICYKDKKIIEFLLNVLERYENQLLLDYLPQIVNVFFYYEENEGFLPVFYKLLEISQDVALDLYWTCRSYMNNKRPSKFLLFLDTCIVNGSKSIQNQSLYTIKNLNELENPTKLDRSEYLEYQKEFVNMLKQISIDLNSEVEYTKVFLSSFLMQLESLIEKNRVLKASSVSLYTKRLFRGIIIPLINENNTLQIVRILPEESIPLRTREKVPYLLIVETIDISEQEIPPKQANPEKKLSKKQKKSKKNKKAQKTQKTPKSPSSSQTSSQFFDLLCESWEQKSARLQQSSPFGHYPSWTLRGLLIKANDNLQQERLAMQIIKKCCNIFSSNSLPIFLRPYKIQPLDSNSGLIEFIPNSVSIHSLKSIFSSHTLTDIFFYLWPTNFESAQKNFIHSMAGYSLLSYILNLKDRHNGNILIDCEGHVIHIDFGFFLSNSPGKLGFESAGFKLTKEMIELMGGIEGGMFKLFEKLIVEGFLMLRKYEKEICVIVELMAVGSNFECFADKELAVEGFRKRFFVGLNESECIQKIREVIQNAAGNWRTHKYDWYQSAANGICS